AVADLNSLQSNAAVLAKFVKEGLRNYGSGLQDLLVHLGRLGYQANDLNALNAIHIAGTKGKGSTAKFSESILGEAGRISSKEGLKMGMYTSPHLVEVRERIRLNGRPISQVLFAKYFYECWDAIIANYKPGDTLRPGYFHFLTLLAFHTFLREKVDVAILEVGIGGKYDSTNLVPRPVVCGITSLGLDHQSVLGNTLAEIAAQK
ncbi:Mur ligase, partial [Dimargaris cristalligena]